MDEKRDPDIDNVIREEQSRGRRPVNADEVRRQAQRRAYLMQLLRNRDLDGAVSALRESGLTDAEIDEFVKLWRKLLR